MTLTTVFENPLPDHIADQREYILQFHSLSLSSQAPPAHGVQCSTELLKVGVVVLDIVAASFDITIELKQ